MGVTEIVLLAVGGIIFILSFLIPARGEGTRQSDEEVRNGIQSLMEKEFDTFRGQMEEAADEAAERASEKAERALERLSNEKIMAVNEYSDTVLAQIHRDHEEAVFLYDMLNNKQAGLKNMMAEINRTVKEAESAVDSLQKWTAEEGTVLLEDIVADAPDGACRELPEDRGAGVLIRPADAADAMGTEAEENQEESGRRENRNEEILALYRQGKSEVAIAKELGLGVGVVQLVCNLYKGR